MNIYYAKYYGRGGMMAAGVKNENIEKKMKRGKKNCGKIHKKGEKGLLKMHLIGL